MKGPKKSVTFKEDVFYDTGDTGKLGEKTKKIPYEEQKSNPEDLINFFRHRSSSAIISGLTLSRNIEEKEYDPDDLINFSRHSSSSAILPGPLANHDHNLPYEENAGIRAIGEHSSFSACCIIS